MDVVAMTSLAMLTAFVARWGYALAGTRDKGPEWEPPRSHTWPFHVHRDGYRRLLAGFIAAWLVGIVVILRDTVAR